MSPPTLFVCFGSRRKERRKMPCTNCMTEYTRRKKEIACAVCRFGFCERCVNQKYAVPSVSPARPVPVCNNCYKLLTDPTRQWPLSVDRPVAEKSRDLPPIGVPFEQNAWGTDRLPPPSLRSLYSTAKAGKNGGGGAKASEWSDLEARLARLNEPTQFGEPTMATTSAKVQQRDGTHTAPPPIEELEERLAALRGVPVEVVRKPRLMVINDSDEENGSTADVPLSEEAAQLLRQVELDCVPNSSSNYKNNNNNAVKKQTMADDQCSLSSECSSSVLQNAISDALRAPSPSNFSSRTASDGGGQLFPNFAECVRKTVEDAQTAEREAMEFIRKYEHQQQNDDGGGETTAAVRSQRQHQRPITNQKK